MDGAAGDSVRRDDDVRRDRRAARRVGAGGGQGGRPEPPVDRRPVPPGDRQERVADRIRRRSEAEAVPTGPRAAGRRPPLLASNSCSTRTSRRDLTSSSRTSRSTSARRSVPFGAAILQEKGHPPSPCSPSPCSPSPCSPSPCSPSPCSCPHQLVPI